MKQLEKKYKRIVVKIGSSLFYNGEDLDTLRFFEIVSQVSELIKTEKKEVIIVSSGAIALGMSILKLNNRPKDLPLLQAAAAVGQNALMDNYGSYFKQYGISCAQILLTRDDFSNRQRYLNAKNTLLTLLNLAIVPVVNENDTVSTDEIKFGDNDRLSALVASLISADLLIILSDIDGLLDKEKKLVKLVNNITPAVKALACPTERKTSVGGMITKIEAAKIAVDSGIPCIIANGRQRNVIHSAVNNLLSTGTLFVPRHEALAEKQRWIAFGTKPKGKVFIDEGAKKALMNKKSLLSVGVSAVEGNFECGEIVSIVDKNGVEFARGKICLSNSKLDKAKGTHTDKEVMHCDNIVVL